MAAVLDALGVTEPDPADVVRALTVFAWERAGTSGDLMCTIADVDELWDLLEASGGPPVPRTDAQHCVVDAWVDAVAAERGSPGIHPLSGLHTTGYLYGRVHELDRLSGNDPMALVLLVVRWTATDGPWTRIERMLHVAAALRSRVRPEATLSQVCGDISVALVPDDARARQERITLTKAFERAELSTANVQVDVFAVPDVRSQLPELMTQLHPNASVDLATGSPSCRHPGTCSLD